MNAAELFVRCLENEGVTRIYGVPGEENADFLIALEKSEIEFVQTRHEQGAAFMAAVHGRLTGEAGVCLGTLGPGATNLVTGVADGNMDRAPLIVLTGQAATTRLHKESHQVMNVMEMYRTITKWATSILHPATIPEITRKAFKVATTEKPGAVHIELPEDIAKMTVEGDPLKVIKTRRSAPDPKALEQAWEKIKSAKTPLIIAGNGTIRKRASKQLRQFCEKTGIGVLMTFMAKGAVDLDNEQCLFTIGMGQKDIALKAVQSADLIITIGYDMVEYPPEKWNPKSNKDIVHLDFIPAEVDQSYIPSVEVVGDLANTLWQLNGFAQSEDLPDFDLRTQVDVLNEMQKEFEKHADDTGSGPIRPQKILSDVRDTLDPEDIVLSGVGAHKMWIARHYQCHEPNTCIISNGFCSMGMALPGAIAAHYACPKRKILAIVGDGDIMMNLQEMETARRLNSDITVLVWEDHEFGLIAWKQEQEFGKHTKLGFDNPDWTMLAKSFGWQAHQCNEAGNFKQALKQALEHNGPSLLVVPIDYRENMKLTKRLGEITLDF